MDPSLVRPVPVRLLAFIVERNGFKVHHVTFSSSGDQEELSQHALTNEVYPYNEYTIVAIND
jgi:hypothetical protein